MADFGLTQLNATIKELWDTKVEEARYAEAVIVNRVSNRSEVAKQKGDRIHVPIDQTYTAGDVGSDGTFTPQNYNVGVSTIVLNQWSQVAVQILDQAASQSFWTPDSTFPTNAGKAFGVDYDSNLAGLHTSITTNVVGDPGSPAAFGKGSAQEAMFKLSNANIPLTNLSFILHPVSYFGGIVNEEQLTAANQAGLPKNVLTTGFRFPLLGAPVYLSTNIAEVAGPPAVKKNLLLHKSALSIAWSKTNMVEKVRSTANLTLADLVVMQSVWGYLAVREDHAVVINNAAAGAF